MKVAISGASGLIGSAIAEHLRGRGHAVLRLVRRPLDQTPEPHTVHWQPEDGGVDISRLEGADWVIHLAGESIAGLWTAGKKRRIRRSRVEGTRTLCQALSRMSKPPATLLCASAVGYYGDRGDQVLTEDSPVGDGFLPVVCHEWETETAAAAEQGMRVVNLRFGIVLAREGGALQQMVRPFRFGLGGRIGNGAQYMSWITLADVARAVGFAGQTPTLRGPVNVTAPHPVTNAEFTKSLGRTLHRPTLLPIPAGPLRLLPGGMAQEMLLCSARVFPQRLQAAGFHFLHDELDDALASVLNP